MIIEVFRLIAMFEGIFTHVERHARLTKFQKMEGQSIEAKFIAVQY